MRRCLQLALLLPLLLALMACQQRSQPNLIVFSMDTTRADHIGAYGRDVARTPNIDRLAERGFLFERHLSPSPVTLPGHSSLFSGLFPPAHTARDNGAFALPADVLTLAEVLQGAGYNTSAFIGSFPLTAQFGLDQGFDHYDDDLDPDKGRSRFSMRAVDRIFFDERPAGEVVQAAIEFHRERDDAPFFSFLHFFDPHQPLRAPPPFDIEFRNRPYDGEIAYVDEQIGRFLSFLEQRGDLDNTLIVLTADHGEGLGEHGELTHSTLLHQATLHIPLVIAGPGVAAGRTRAWSSSTEVFATLLELIGIDPGKQVRDGVGRSLVPLIANAGVEPPRWAPFESYFETIAPRAVQGASQLTAWMEGDIRLVHGPRPELYDLEKDPRELDNRFDQQPDRAADMLETLRAFLRQTERSSVGAASKRADADTLQRLAGLGYIQFDPDALKDLDDMLNVEGLVDPKDAVTDVSLYSEARAAVVTGKWSLAMGLYTDLLRRLPDNPKAHADMALVQVQLGDAEAALRHLEAAQRANPQDLALLRQRASVLIELGRVREGLDMLLAQATGIVELSDCIWVATAHRRLGELEQAGEWYARCAEMPGESPWPRLLLANFVAGQGDAERAESIYRELLAEHPYFALGFYNFGKLLYDTQREDLARGYFERSLRLSPRHQPSQDALRLMAKGSKDEA